MNHKDLRKLYNMLTALIQEVDRPSEDAESIKKVVFVVVGKMLESGVYEAGTEPKSL